MKWKEATQLALNASMHNDLHFQELLLTFAQKLCPDDGIFSYLDGTVVCNIHKNGTDSEQPEDSEGVPYL